MAALSFEQQGGRSPQWPARPVLRFESPNHRTQEWGVLIVNVSHGYKYFYVVCFHMEGEDLVKSTRNIVSNYKSEVILILLALVPIVLDAPLFITTMIIFITLSIFAYRYHIDKIRSLELEIEQLEVFKRTGLELDGDTRLARKHIYIYIYILVCLPRVRIGSKMSIK